jgi:hypothetical protein
MLEKLRAFGAIRWVVAYTMEGAACCIVNGTIDDVSQFLGLDDETGFPAEEWLDDFNEPDNWSKDEGGDPFRFSLMFGEIARVEVTRVTGDDWQIPPAGKVLVT